MFYHRDRPQHPDFQMIQKRLAPEEALGRLTEGLVKLNGDNNEISTTCAFIPATIVFNHGIRTFTIGNGSFIMGWCDPNNPYHNILILFNYGTYAMNGWWKKCSKELKNGDNLRIKKGDIITFGISPDGIVLTINNSTNLLDISLLGHEAVGLNLWKVFCYMENGSIIYE
jgi:hypothetical protein